MANGHKKKPVHVKPEPNPNGTYRYYFPLGKYPGNYEDESKRGKRWKVREGSYQTPLEAYKAGFAEAGRLIEKYQLQRAVIDESADVEKKQQEHFKQMGYDMFSQQTEPPPESNHQSMESDEPGAQFQPKPTAESPETQEEKQSEDADARLHDANEVQNGASKPPSMETVEPSDGSQEVKNGAEQNFPGVQLREIPNGYQWTIAGRTRQFFGKSAKYDAIAAGYHFLIERAEMNNQPEEKKRLQAERRAVLDALQNGDTAGTAENIEDAAERQSIEPAHVPNGIEAAPKPHNEARTKLEKTVQSGEKAARELYDEARTKPGESERGNEPRAEAEHQEAANNPSFAESKKSDDMEPKGSRRNESSSELMDNSRPIKVDVSREANTDAAKTDIEHQQDKKKWSKPKLSDLPKAKPKNMYERIHQAYDLSGDEKILAEELYSLSRGHHRRELFPVYITTLMSRIGRSYSQVQRLLTSLDTKNVIHREKQKPESLGRGKGFKQKETKVSFLWE